MKKELITWYLANKRDLPWRQNRDAGDSLRACAVRLEQGGVQYAHDQRHLRARDVRDVVQDDLDDPERPRYLPRHHPPLPLHGVPAGLRPDALRQERQNRVEGAAASELNLPFFD